MCLLVTVKPSGPWRKVSPYYRERFHKFLTQSFHGDQVHPIPHEAAIAAPAVPVHQIGPGRHLIS